VEAEILRLSALLEKRTEEHAEYAEQAARTEAAHKAAYARTFLTVKAPTAKEREYIAEDQNADLFEQRKIAAALADSTLESCRSLRAQLSALQSIGANIRALMGNAA
jgi:hypothetical protein